MATEKLAEGIRAFVADARTLDTIAGGRAVTMGRVLRFPGRRGWLAALLALALAGCATPRGADRATEAVRADGPELSGGQGRVREAFSPGGLPDGFGVAWCTNLYEALEGQVRNRQVIDAGEQRLPGYPFLRSNRFLASFAPDFSAQLEAGKPADDGERATRAAALLQTPAFRDWIGRLQQLDTHVRRLEVNRLPDESFPLYHLPNRMQLEDSLSRCAPLMAAHLTPADVPRVLQQAVVPDEYRRSLRALGLYPLTGIGVASSIRNWEADQRRVFRSERRPSLSGRASFQRYRPAQQISGADAWRTAAQIMRDVPRDALGIPQFSAAQRSCCSWPSHPPGRWPPPPIPTASAACSGSIWPDWCAIRTNASGWMSTPTCPSSTSA